MISLEKFCNLDFFFIISLLTVKKSIFFENLMQGKKIILKFYRKDAKVFAKKAKIQKNCALCVPVLNLIQYHSGLCVFAVK